MLTNACPFWSFCIGIQISCLLTVFRHMFSIVSCKIFAKVLLKLYHRPFLLYTNCLLLRWLTFLIHFRVVRYIPVAAMNQAYVRWSLVVSNITVCTNMPFIIWNYITGNICYVLTLFYLPNMFYLSWIFVLFKYMYVVKLNQNIT